MTKQTLLSWCDQQVKDGKELKIVWDGGHDSGWVHFEIDGEDYEDEHTERLVNYMNDKLDYGSWAGEFNASGDAIYNVEEQAFVGTDYYSESQIMIYNTNISISIPKHLWFNELSIRIEADYEDTPVIEAGFGIRNGFLTEEHNNIEKEISNYVQDEIIKAIEKFEEEKKVGFESIWDEVTIPFTSFKEEGDNRVAFLEDVDFRYPQGHDNDIYLDLKTIEIDDED